MTKGYLTSGHCPSKGVASSPLLAVPFYGHSHLKCLVSATQKNRSKGGGWGIFAALHWYTPCWLMAYEHDVHEQAQADEEDLLDFAAMPALGNA